ncbi:MAG TPA: multicopper oxidase domain-containing protein, partial [Longimicrobiaceae bacterium]|nr:multicopper oxidase domain-containing protein [Longimicrobiaceae bacterium]
AVGVRVLPPRGRQPAAPAPPPARRLRLLVQSRPGYHGSAPGFGYVLQDGREPAADSVAIPGTPMLLTRGEPVQVTVVNRLAEPTSVHWHGIELDSWFDGVSGWSGSGARTAPQIAPGDSFLVRFTPPRAGTFIYHTHFEEERQLPAGLYGALLVLEPGERYDPERERLVVLSAYPGERARLQVNGSRDAELRLRAGRSYRVRLINIHANAAPRLALLADSVPVSWRLLAKDGATVPPAQATVRPAVLRIGVGETYDFALEAGAPRELRLVGRDATGAEVVAARVRVVP